MFRRGFSVSEAALQSRREYGSILQDLALTRQQAPFLDMQKRLAQGQTACREIYREVHYLASNQRQQEHRGFSNIEILLAHDSGLRLNQLSSRLRSEII